MTEFNYPDAINVKLKYSTLVFGGIITALITIVFIITAHFYHINYEIRDIVALITCGVVCTTLIYHAKNLKLNFEANKAKLDFDIFKYNQEKDRKITEQSQRKIAYSFEATAPWFRGDMSAHAELARAFLRTHKDELNNSPIANIKSKLESDTETRRAIACVLNYFENLSVMINEKIVDEDTIKKCFKTLFVDYHKVLRRYIDDIQSTSARYLLNFEDVAKKWERN